MQGRLLGPEQQRISPEEQQIVDLTNERRQQDGLPPLTPDPKLMNVARAHSEDLATHPSLWSSHPDHQGHYGSDGSTPEGRIGAAIGPGWWGENVARGDQTAQDAFDGWFNEGPGGGHHDVILSRYARFVGVGIAQAPDGTRYYTEDFWG
jgi:uncharacterized protein YkwD